MKKRELVDSAGSFAEFFEPRSSASVRTTDTANQLLWIWFPSLFLCTCIFLEPLIAKYGEGTIPL